MTKCLLLMMLFLAQSMVSSAQVKLYMENFTLSSGEYKQVSLLLDNDQTVTQMQVEIALPTGMRYSGNLVKTDRVKGRGATVQASTSTGKLVIVETGGTIEPGSGEVITFGVYDNGLTEGDHTITLSNIIISDANGDQLNQEETNTVTVKKLGLGDCSFAGPETLNVTVGQEYQVDITLTNEGIYNLSALQGKLALPAGLEIVPGEDGKFIYSYRTPAPLEFTFKEYDGYTSFVLSSSSNTTIDYQRGVIFSFKVKADVSLAENTTILLSNLRVAATTGLSADVPNVEINVVNTSIADKAAFDAYQADKLAAVEAMSQDSDSETTQAMIADAKAAIEALTFDYALSLNANKSVVNAIFDKLTADVTAQRDQEARALAANETLAALKTAAEALTVSAEAKAYEAENVQTAVATAETAIADANIAVAAVEAKIAEGINAENADALAAAIATAENTLAAAKTAVAAAEQLYKEQKALDDAAEAGAKASAEASVTSLKVAMEEVVILEEAKAYEAENVKAAVATAEESIAAANVAIKAIEDLIAEGKLATDNKEAVAKAILVAQKTVEAAALAAETANNVYTEQKATDDADAAAALAAAKADLQTVLEAAKAAETEGMTNESVQTLTDAIAAAEAAVAAEDATVESLNAVKVVLEAAVAGLTPKPNPLFADGTYYLFNAAVNQYMAAGSSWGTHAVTNTAGLDYTLAFTADGKYTIDSQVSNGGDNHFLNGEWNDGAAMGWIFAPVEGAEGIYTISNGENFLTAQGENGEVLLQADASSSAQWTLKTKEQRIAELAAATKDAPVDATFLVADGNFNRNDLRKSAWTGEDFSVNGDNTNMNAEKWGGNSQTFDIKQTIELPNGVYRVTWNGYYRYNNTDDNTNDIAAAAHADGTEVINSFVYLNDKDFALTSIADEAAVASFGKMPFSQGDASAAFGQGLYEQAAEVTVTEGSLTIGIKKTEHLGTDWTVWDNFRLVYLGTGEIIPTGIQTVMSEKNAEGIFNLNGQKIQKTQKGLYIMNGKKVFIK